VASSAYAAPIYSITTTQKGANIAYSLYIDTNGTAMNGLDMQATPGAGFSFLLPDSGYPLGGPPRPAGQLFTYRNRYLDLDPADPEFSGGKGWTLVAPITAAALVTISGGPLGQKIDTAGEPGGKLFLANFLLPANGTFAALLKAVNGAQVVDVQNVVPGIPEPATLGLAGLSLIALVAATRQPRRHLSPVD
jgi:hypothetical protein